MCDWKLQTESKVNRNILGRSNRVWRISPSSAGKTRSRENLRLEVRYVTNIQSRLWDFFFECRVLFPVILLILEVVVGRKNCMKMICRLEFDRPSCRRFKQCLQDISRRSSLSVPDHGISFFPGKTSNKVWSSYHVRV